MSFVDSFRWASFESAVHDWLASVTGLDSSHVIWINVRQTIPTRPYATLKRTGMKDLGFGLHSIEKSYDFDENAEQGQEISAYNVGRHGVVISVQFFATPVVGDAQRTVSSASERTALDYAHAAGHSLSVDSIIDGLFAAGIASIDCSDVRDIPEGKDNAWASRAQIDVTFGVCDTLTDKLGYIAEVKGTGTIKDSTGATAATISFDVDERPASSLELVSGDDQIFTAGTELANQLVVLAKDHKGLPAENVEVFFAAATAGSSIAPATVRTNSDGLARATARLKPTAGANSFTADIPGATGSPVSFDVTGT